GGRQTQTLGTLQRQGNAAATWTVRGDTDGLKQLTATASATAYGSTLSGTATKAITVDATPPTVTLAAPSGTTQTEAIAVQWGANDSGSKVAGYDVEVATNGGPYVPWLTAAAQTSAGHPGST